MDFARKQLEKYGWTDGKGLGKYENGMSEALKPKLKRSMTGIGHDAAADFTEHWWSALYDKAASNIEVKEKDGHTKKIKAKDDTGFEITNSTWKLKKKQRTSDEKQEQYQDFFVKTAVLGSGGSKVERVREQDSESEGDDESERNVFKMTDEELFAACGGRTAHKGARHGLKALGKLARIEQQEQLLLQQSKFNGYSHAKKLKKSDESDEKVVEDATLILDEEQTERKKKKSKKKHCLRSECGAELNVIECENTSRIKKKKKKSKNSGTCDEMENDCVVEEENTESSKKIKKKKCDGDTMAKNENEIVTKIQNRKKESNSVNDVLSINYEEPEMKRNNADLDSNVCKMDVDIASNEEQKIKRKKKKRRE